MFEFISDYIEGRIINEKIVAQARAEPDQDSDNDDQNANGDDDDL